MTVDSGGGGMGGGCDTVVDTEAHEKEMHARLINYHTSFSSQDSNHASASITGWFKQSQEPSTVPEDLAVDDPDSLTTLWPDDPDSGHPFTRAALQGDVNTIKEYVARQTFDPTSKKSQHALLVACRTGNVELTQVLLQAGVDVHCKDAKSGWQPIHIATYRDHVAVVEALAMHGEWRRGVALVRFRGITCNLLHLAANFGCLAVLRYLLSHTVRLGLQIEVRDAAHWTALHHAAFEGRLQAVTLLLQAGADVNTADPHGVTALHVAAYRDHMTIVRFLMTRGANPKMIVKSPTSGTERGLERVEPIIKFHAGSTLLHWAAAKGYDDLVADLLARGLTVDAGDRLGRTPLGLAMWSGHTSIVNTLLQEKVVLSEDDKDWRSIVREEVGLSIVRVIEETAVCGLDTCRSDGFTLLHLAAQHGYPNMMHRLLSLKLSPDMKNNHGETPLFVAIRSNQLACVQQLINAGTRLSLVDNRGGTALHMAAKNGNVTVIDMLLTTSELEERDVDINRCDNIGYTPIYYAINASRYDIVQRFLEYSLVRKVHVKATNGETLLQFYTERNNLGQYDNAVVRVLECEKLLHTNKPSAEMCLRVQLGTTEASSKARSQLQAMYESTRAQRHCWNFWFFLSCFLLPSVFYYLDVYTDILLAVEYYQDYMRNMNLTDYSGENHTQNAEEIAASEEVDSKSYNNFPSHGNTKTYRHHMRDMKIRKYYDLKHVAQMRVAITNVMEATLESAFQLILQLYIVGTRYTELDKVKDVTLGSILSLSPRGTETQLSKQVFSVLISLVSLTWSFTSYHRFSKLGGLTILNALPLLFAIFFQVVSRAIACTLFTLAYTWKVFVVLGIHFIIVLVFKLKLEESSSSTHGTRSKLGLDADLNTKDVIDDASVDKSVESVLPVRNYICCHCFLAYLRPYFYVFLGTIASTLVYFRLERPSAVKKQLSRRHSTVVIQVLFLILAFIENLVLLSLGIVGLDKVKYDNTFIIISAVLCAISYLTGVILHAVYYSCFGHPWVDINGPTVSRDPDEGTLVFAYYRQGQVSKWAIHSCCTVVHHNELPTDNIYRQDLQINGKERQVKDL
ncbi:uncharacterized protein [Procambarus clarkii]|uniref:uncharacterized protein isoform X4 n=1 Tax=Procambarus clarkii TaxID=6728 RepID=UPI003743EE0C